MKITEIGQIAITVSDVSTALKFYRDILGLEFLFSPASNLAFLQCGSTRIMLTQPQGAGEVGKNSILYFKTINIEEFFSAAVTKGAKSERHPSFTAKMSGYDLWIGFLRDPDDNLVGILEEKKGEP